MSTDQKPASTDQTPVPTPPPARSAKSTNKTSKLDASTKKAKKIRKLSKEQIAEEADKLVAAANADAFPDKMISASAWANKMNLSLAMVDKVFISSKLARGGYDLDDDVNVKATDNRPYIDTRGMLMIAKSIFTAHNAGAAADKQFAPGQQFDVTLEDDRIILTRAS
ncbi:hypothetical protein [Desulfovibrio sp. TomC]|uniref:hypothetical protein n=1 Tax=Desulfovibrio sp. TomC TaxID=1562888 RepID=UPI000574875C|nr:hypothetical protein [Desulfovibrio sp. TomC]KHK01333.1 hypothetical protein NY78_3315 [Desulfovibrio sp. TomC]